MDKNIITTLICSLIFYLVYLKITENNIHKKREIEIEPEIEHENFGNNIVTDKFDIHNFYKNKTKTNTSKKITKDNFDDDYETDFKYKDIPIIGEDNKEHFHNFVMYTNNNLNLQTQGGGKRNLESQNSVLLDSKWVYSTMTGNPDFLVPNELEPNFIYSVPFPENTSIELAQFNAENVTDLFKSNNMEDLYNNINADVYKGYKTMKYML
jgi:hypothetical protein